MLEKQHMLLLNLSAATRARVRGAPFRHPSPEASCSHRRRCHRPVPCPGCVLCPLLFPLCTWLRYRSGRNSASHVSGRSWRGLYRQRFAARWSAESNQSLLVRNGMAVCWNTHEIYRRESAVSGVRGFGTRLVSAPMFILRRLCRSVFGSRKVSKKCPNWPFSKFP